MTYFWAVIHHMGIRGHEADNTPPSQYAMHLAEQIVHGCAGNPKRIEEVAIR